MRKFYKPVLLYRLHGDISLRAFFKLESVGTPVVAAIDNGY